MSSSNDLTDISNWDDSYVSKNVQKAISTILKHVNGSNNVTKLKALKFAFHSCVKEISTNDLETVIFGTCCPAAVDVYTNAISGLDYVDGCSQAEGLVHVCIEILGLLQSALDLTTNYKVIHLVQVRSLLKCSWEILYLSYKHHKSRNELHGEFLNEVMADMFNQTQVLKDSLLMVLTRVECTCEMEETVCDLDVILTFVNQSACVLVGFDVKTMAELWKTYATITTKYSKELQQIHNVAIPIIALCGYITDGLYVISNGVPDTATLVKHLKVLSFYLKITIKLCEAFPGYLGNCNNQLLDLLCCLVRCMGPCLKIRGVPPEVAAEINNHVTIGFEPLLSHLLLDRGLVVACSARCESMATQNNSAFGIVYIACCVLKKILQSDKEMRQLWFAEDGTVLDWIFNCLPFCETELRAGLEFPGVLVPGKAKRNIDLYEMTLTAMATFILNCSPREFTVVETLLLRNILQCNPWPALLAIDVWCVLARFGSSELCFQQLQAVCPLLTEMEAADSRPELCYLWCLVTRLLPFLLPQHRLTLCSFYPDLDRSENSSEATCNAILNFISHRPGDLKPYSRMELQLLHLDDRFKSPRNPFTELVGMIGDLWKFDCERLEMSGWSRRLLRLLCRATGAVLDVLEVDLVVLVVQQLRRLLRRTQDVSCRLAMLGLLMALATLNFPHVGHLTVFKDGVADICQQLLTSEHVVARCHGLDTFCRVAHVTVYSDILSSSVAKDSELLSRVQNFLNKKCVSEDPALPTLQVLPRYQHSCPYSHDFSAEPVIKKLKLSPHDDEDILDGRETLCRWLCESDKLVKCFEKLSATEKTLVADKCRTLSDLS